MQPLRLLAYRLSRAFVARLVRPTLAGRPVAGITDHVFYMLPRRGVSDLIVLDIVAAAHDLPRPLEPLTVGQHVEDRRFAFLHRPAGMTRRHTMRTYSDRLVRLLEDEGVLASDATLQPVQIFWGRAQHRDKSVLQTLMSENWAATSRLKRFLNLFISRNNIVADFGNPIPLSVFRDTEPPVRVRKAARLLRVQFRNQKVALLGPDFSHRRTLVDEIVASRSVSEIIERAPEDAREAEREAARNAALAIASDMSWPTIRLLESVLTWFWNHIYDGVAVNGIERVNAIAPTHTLVYVPSHRSHVDYLLLSWLLYHNKLMVPHIAAGDNLNLPVVGGILRRGGAFFMRRSFRNDVLYATVFSEYLYQVFRRGHSVELFPEGGRSRTGRLLPARTGLIQMTLRHAERGLPKPLAFVPVYLGYEKLVEARSYLDELRGAEKRSESITDVFRSLRLVRENFGRVEVNFAEPLIVDAPATTDARAFGEKILMSVNDNASVNPVNLVALVLLATPRLAIERDALVRQIDLYQELIRRGAGPDVSLSALDANQVIEYVENLRILVREKEPFGEVLGLEPGPAVLMTWYRNNVVHVLALPSLIACLVIARRRPLPVAVMQGMVDVVFPHLAAELHASSAHANFERWLDLLVDCGLLVRSPEGLSAPPNPGAQHFELQLLSRVVMQTLERQYIVVSLLGRSPITRQQLQDQSQLVAHKIARLHGINAPEFFDPRLFDGFVDRLIENGTVNERPDGTLAQSALVAEIVRAAERVIDPELRDAIMRG